MSAKGKSKFLHFFRVLFTVSLVACSMFGLTKIYNAHAYGGQVDHSNSDFNFEEYHRLYPLHDVDMTPGLNAVITYHSYVSYLDILKGINPNTNWQNAYEAAVTREKTKTNRLVLKDGATATIKYESKDGGATVAYSDEIFNQDKPSLEIRQGQIPLWNHCNDITYSHDSKKYDKGTRTWVKNDDKDNQPSLNKSFYFGLSDEAPNIVENDKKFDSLLVWSDTYPNGEKVSDTTFGVAMKAVACCWLCLNFDNPLEEFNGCSHEERTMKSISQKGGCHWNGVVTYLTNVITPEQYNAERKQDCRGGNIKYLKFLESNSMFELPVDEDSIFPYCGWDLWNLLTRYEGDENADHKYSEIEITLQNSNLKMGHRWGATTRSGNYTQVDPNISERTVSYYWDDWTTSPFDFGAWKQIYDEIYKDYTDENKKLSPLPKTIQLNNAIFCQQDCSLCGKREVFAVPTQGNLQEATCTEAAVYYYAAVFSVDTILQHFNSIDGEKGQHSNDYIANGRFKFSANDLGQNFLSYKDDEQWLSNGQKDAVLQKYKFLYEAAGGTDFDTFIQRMDLNKTLLKLEQTNHIGFEGLGHIWKIDVTQGDHGWSWINNEKGDHYGILNLKCAREKCTRAAIGDSYSYARNIYTQLTGQITTIATQDKDSNPATCTEGGAIGYITDNVFGPDNDSFKQFKQQYGTKYDEYSFVGEDNKEVKFKSENGDIIWDSTSAEYRGHQEIGAVSNPTGHNWRIIEGKLEEQSTFAPPVSSEGTTEAYVPAKGFESAEELKKAILAGSVTDEQKAYLSIIFANKGEAKGTYSNADSDFFEEDGKGTIWVRKKESDGTYTYYGVMVFVCMNDNTHFLAIAFKAQEGENAKANHNHGSTKPHKIEIDYGRLRYGDGYGEGGPEKVNKYKATQYDNFQNPSSVQDIISEYIEETSAPVPHKWIEDRSVDGDGYLWVASTTEGAKVNSVSITLVCECGAQIVVSLDYKDDFSDVSDASITEEKQTQSCETNGYTKYISKISPSYIKSHYTVITPSKGDEIGDVIVKDEDEFYTYLKATGEDKKQLSDGEFYENTYEIEEDKKSQTGHNWKVDTSYTTDDGFVEGWKWDPVAYDETHTKVIVKYTVYVRLVCENHPEHTITVTLADITGEHSTSCTEYGRRTFTAKSIDIDTLKGVSEKTITITDYDTINGEKDGTIEVTRTDIYNDETYTEEPLGHKWHLDETHDSDGFEFISDSTTAGDFYVVMYLKCDDCGQEISFSSKDSNKHLQIEKVTTPATCEDAGNISYTATFKLTTEAFNEYVGEDKFTTYDNFKTQYEDNYVQGNLGTIVYSATHELEGAAPRKHLWQVDTTASATKGGIMVENTGYEWVKTSSGYDVYLHLICATAMEASDEGFDGPSMIALETHKAVIKINTVSEPSTIDATCIEKSYKLYTATYDEGDNTTLASSIEGQEYTTENSTFNIDGLYQTCDYKEYNDEELIGHSWTIDKNYGLDGCGYEWLIEEEKVTVILHLNCENCPELFTITWTNDFATSKESENLSRKQEDPSCVLNGHYIYTLQTSLEEIQERIKEAYPDLYNSGGASLKHNLEEKDCTNSISKDLEDDENAYKGHKWEINTTDYPNGWEFADLASGNVRALLHLTCAECGATTTIEFTGNNVNKNVIDATCNDFATTEYNVSLTPEYLNQYMREHMDVFTNKDSIFDRDGYLPKHPENVDYNAYLKLYEEYIEPKTTAERKKELEPQISELIHKNVIADLLHKGHDNSEIEKMTGSVIIVDSKAKGHDWVIDLSFGEGTGWTWAEVDGKWEATIHMFCANCDDKYSITFSGDDIQIDAHPASCEEDGYTIYSINIGEDKLISKVDDKREAYYNKVDEYIASGIIATTESNKDKTATEYKKVKDTFKNVQVAARKSSITVVNADQKAKGHDWVIDTNYENPNNSEGGFLYLQDGNTIDLVKKYNDENYKGWRWIQTDYGYGAVLYLTCSNNHNHHYEITTSAIPVNDVDCTTAVARQYVADVIYVGKHYTSYYYEEDVSAPGHNWQIDTEFNEQITGHDGVPADITFENGIAKVVKVNATDTTGATYTVYVKLICTVNNEESIVIKFDMEPTMQLATCLKEAIASYSSTISNDIFKGDKENIIVLDSEKTKLTENDHFATEQINQLTITFPDESVGTPKGHTWEIDKNYGNGTGWTWELLGGNKATATLHFVCGTCGATFEMVQKELVGVAPEKPSCTEDQRVTYTSTMPEMNFATFAKQDDKTQIVDKEGSQVTIINSYSNITAYDKYSTDDVITTSGSFPGKDNEYQGEYIPKTGHVWEIDTQKNGDIKINDGTHTFDKGICWEPTIDEKSVAPRTLYVYLVCANGHHAIAKVENINGIVTDQSCSTSGSIVYSYSLLLRDVRYDLLDEEPQQTDLDKLAFDEPITLKVVLEATGHLWKVDENQISVSPEDNMVISGWTWESNPDGTYTATLHLICEHCGEQQKIIFNGIHGDESKTPTCTEAGQKTYTVTFTPSENDTWNKTGTDELKDNSKSLTSSYMISIPALGHEWTISTTNDKEDEIQDGWTWSADNSHATLHLICNHEGCTYHGTEYTITVATTNVVEEPTCTTDGTTTYTATIDSTHYGKTINDNFNDAIDNKYVGTKEVTQQALGHNWVIVTDNDTEDGIQDGFVWVKDGDSYTVTLKLKCANEEADPLTFTATADSVKTDETKPATCLEKGTKTYTATFSINIDGTTLTNNDTFEGGNKKGTTVTYIATKEETIPVIPHKWTVSDVQWSSDNHLAVVTFSCNQNGSSHTETVIVTTTEDERNGNIIVENDETLKDSVCTGEGTVTYTIKVHYPNAKPEDAFVTDGMLTKTIDPEGLGHEWLVDITKDTDDGILDGFVWVEKEDGTYTVTLNLKCSRCDTTTSLVVDAKCTTNEGEDGYNHCVDDLIKTYTATFDLTNAKANPSPENKFTAKDNIGNVPTTSSMTIIEKATGHTWNIDVEKDTDKSKDGFVWSKVGDSYTATLYLKCTNAGCETHKTVTPVLSATTKAGDCVTADETTYTATYTIDDSDKVVEGLEKTLTSTFTAESTIPGHSWVIDADAKDDTDGLKDGLFWVKDGDSYNVTVYIKCNNTVSSGACSATHSFTIKVTANEEDDKVAPTCTEKGKIIYKATINLDIIKANIYDTATESTYKGEFDKFAEVEIEKIDTGADATGHAWKLDTKSGTDGWTWAREGEKYVAYAHLICGTDNTHTRTVQAEVSTFTNNPTCETEGYTEYTATLTAEKIKDGTLAEIEKATSTLRTNIVPAKGHTWEIASGYENGWEWIWNKETNTYTAKLHLVCNQEKCEQNKVERVLEAKVTTSNVKAATCNTPETKDFTATVELTNLKEGINDTFNGISNTDTKANVETAALIGHNWIVDTTYGEGSGWTWNDDNSQATLHLICKHEDSACGATYEIVVSSTSDEKQKLLCEQDGIIEYTATINSLPSLAAGDLDSRLTTKDKFNGILDLSTSKEVTTEATGHAWQVDTTKGENGFVWTDTSVTLYFTCAHLGCEATHSLTEILTSDNIIDSVDATCTGSSLITYRVQFDLDVSNANGAKNTYACATPQISTKTLESTVTTAKGHIWKISNAVWTEGAEAGWEWTYNESSKDWTVTLHLECARCGQIHTIQFTDITTDNVVHETCLTEGYEDLYCTFNSNDATVENGQKLTEQDNYQLTRASITTNYHGNVIPATGHTWTVDTLYDEDGFVNGWKWDLDTLIATVRLVCVCNSEHTGCAEWCDCDGFTMTATRKTSSVNVPADKCLDDTTTTYTATVLLEDIQKEANTTANDKLIDGVESFTNSITLVTTAALGHQWTIDTDPQYENGWEWSKDYSKAYLHLICSHEGCSEKLTLESNLDVKVVQESSCIQKELTTYTATAIVPDLTAKELASPLTAKDTFIIEGNNVSIKANIETKDALGHQYVLGEWEWYQADLANNESWTARLHFECKVCGDEHVIEADSVSHVTEGSEIKFTATVNKSHFEGKDSYVDGKDVVLTEDQQDTITKDRSSVNHVWIVDESYGDGTGWTWEEVAGKWVATLHFVCQDNDGATHIVVATMSESTIDATCEDCGKIVYNALVDLTPENAYDEAYEGYTNTWGSNIVNTASKEVDDETNKAIGHKWTTDSKWTWSENNTIAALRFVCENDENHVMNVVATTTEVDGNVITIDDHYAPTCTLTGDLIYNAKIIGPDGKTYYSSRVEVVPALGHQYVVDTSKGYNLDGIEWDFVNNTATLVLKCNECGHTIRVATEAIVVDPTDLEAKDATCTDTGLTVYKVEFTNVSSMVGENDKFLGDDTQIGRYEVVVKANGHKWYYEPGEAPTIQEEGPAEWIYQTDERGYVVAVIGVFRCVICGYEERVAGEVDELEIFQEQTCTDDGEYVYYGRVTFEGITYYDGMWFETTIPTTGHNYVIDDTLSEDGITWEEVEGKWMATLHLICSNDNCHHTLEIEKEAIANDSLYVASDCEHDERFVYEVTFDLTGEIASPDTFNANNIQKASKEVIGTKATGHSWNLTPKWFFEEDNHSASASFSCDNCGRTFVMDAAVVEVYTPATCDSNSSSVFTATVTFFGVKYTSSVTVVYDNTALGHVWSDPIWSWSEDNKQATATFICERDHTHIETVVATNSRDLINYIEVDTSNEATCEKDGTIVYTAIITGPDGKEHRNSVTKTVYAIGHDWIIDSNPEYENGFEWLPSGRYAIMHFVCANDATHTHLVEAVITSEVTQELSCAHDEVTIFTATAHFKEYNNDIKLVSRKTVTTKKALEHTYGTPTWVFEDDNTTARAIFTCSKCGHIMALDATMDFVEVVPTCTEDGYTIVTAKVTYNNITYSETRNVVHEKTALGHSWHLSGWTWSEDYSEAVANFVCDRCNENYAGEASIVISNDDDNNTIYTATVIGPDDITYTDIKIVEEVVDISVDFILLLAEIILLIAGTAILGNMISAAGAMMLLLDNKKRKTKQILVKRAG